MIGYKGFDRNFRCRDFQYKVGKTYRHDDELDICVSGFHFCDTPLAVFEYYSPAGSRFALVEATGKIISDGEHKFCTDEITILKELSLDELIAEVDDRYKNISRCNSLTVTSENDCSFVLAEGDISASVNMGVGSIAENTGIAAVAATVGTNSAAITTSSNSLASCTRYQSIAISEGAYSVAGTTGGYSIANCRDGYCSVAASTGRGSAALNDGYSSVAVATGILSVAKCTDDSSVAITTKETSNAKALGKNSIAVAAGINNKAMGSLGCWLVLTEWSALDAISDVQVVKVDGVNIKPDVFYQLVDGKPVEVEVAS